MKTTVIKVTEDFAKRVTNKRVAKNTAFLEAFKSNCDNPIFKTYELVSMYGVSTNSAQALLDLGYASEIGRKGKAKIYKMNLKEIEPIHGRYLAARCNQIVSENNNLHKTEIEYWAEVEDAVKTFLEKPITKNWYKKSKEERRSYFQKLKYEEEGDTQRVIISTPEIWNECISEDLSKLSLGNNYNSKYIHSILRSLDNWVEYPSKGKKTVIEGYGRLRAYKRKQADQKPFRKLDHVISKIEEYTVRDVNSIKSTTEVDKHLKKVCPNYKSNISLLGMALTRKYGKSMLRTEKGTAKRCYNIRLINKGFIATPKQETGAFPAIENSILESKLAVEQGKVIEFEAWQNEIFKLTNTNSKKDALEVLFRCFEDASKVEGLRKLVYERSSELARLQRRNAEKDINLMLLEQKREKLKKGSDPEIEVQKSVIQTLEKFTERVKNLTNSDTREGALKALESLLNKENLIQESLPEKTYFLKELHAQKIIGFTTDKSGNIRFLNLDDLLIK